jgi:hypothetical protein
MAFLKLQDDSLLLLEGTKVGYEGHVLLQASTVLNTTASTNVPTHYNICAISGFKALPHELVKDEYSGEMVLPEFADRQHRQPKRMPTSPSKVTRVEPREPTFITDRILPEDL